MIDSETLRGLSPFSGMLPENLAQLLPALREVAQPGGQTLFTRGEEDTWSVYLLRGEVDLYSDPDSPPLRIRAGTESACHPLSRLKPRRYTAVARGPVQLLLIDDALLDRALTLDQTAAYQVTEFEGDDPEWMLTLLTHPAFARVPADNFAELFARLESMSASAGQVILRQGEPGDYYYLIRKGQAQVRKAAPNQPEALLATLGVGQGFGEEALLSGEPRNATVSMLSDGLLMRIGHEDFLRLLGGPLVHWIGADEAARLTVAGAMMIDVRLPEEYREGSLRGAINVPLSQLRQKAAELDPGHKYIVFCQSGRRCSAAAFLLSQRGFDVFVLRDGLQGLRRQEAEASPAVE